MEQTNEKKPMGGKRPGAGRKPSEQKLKRYDVMLSDIDIAIAAKIGEGNRSLGIRRALNSQLSIINSQLSQDTGSKKNTSTLD